MSRDRSSEEEVILRRIEQELLVQVLKPAIHHIEGDIMGSLGSINNSSEGDSIVSPFGKLVEAMVMNTIHCVLVHPALEKWIRSIAKEEIDTAVEKFLTGNSNNEMGSSEQKRLQLEFSTKLVLPVWTGITIKGEKGTSIEVALVDGATGDVVESGPKASAKVEIVVLQGDDDFDGKLGWTSEEFNRNITRGREGNKSILIGNVYLDLKEGIGCVGEIHFTHNSSWTKNSRFRLGARIVDNGDGIRVREAVSDSFTIRDRRTKLYEKHEVPSPDDAVWRLKNISRRGSVFKRLKEGGIITVRDFLTEHFINPQRLQEILGTAVSVKILEETVAHALKCKLDDKLMHYSSCSQQSTGVVFNVVGQPLGVSFESHYVPVDKSEEQKVDANQLVVSASEHKDEVINIGKFSGCDDFDLSNASYTSNSHEVESLRQHGDWVLDTTGNNANALLSDSCQNITSSNEYMSIADDSGFCYTP